MLKKTTFFFPFPEHSALLILLLKKKKKIYVSRASQAFTFFFIRKYICKAKSKIWHLFLWSQGNVLHET